MLESVEIVVFAAIVIKEGERKGCLFYLSGQFCVSVQYRLFFSEARHQWPGLGGGDSIPIPRVPAPGQK